MKKYIPIIILTLALLTLASCGHEHTPAVDNAVTPTCTAAGLTEGSHCSECGEVITAQEEVAKLEHTTVVDKAVAPTCSSVGLTEGSHCSECGEVLTAQEEVAKTEHTAVTDNAVAPTCKATGLTDGSHCSECGEVLTAQEEVAKLEHTAVVDNAVAPTCTATGLTEGSHCSECGEVLTAQKEVAKTEHTVVIVKEDPATCTKKGTSEWSYCSACNTVLVKSRVINKLAHTVIKLPAVAATCNSEGKTEGSYCSVCKTIISAQQTTVKTKHNFQNNICSVCKLTKEQINANMELPLKILNGNIVAIKEMLSFNSSDLPKYIEVTGINSWNRTQNSNCDTYVKDLDWLNTTGFSIATISFDETKLVKSTTVLYSKTKDTSMMSVLQMGIKNTNDLYGKMYSDIIKSFDVFLNNIGSYSTIELVSYDTNGNKVVETGNNLINQFKNKVSDHCTFIEIPDERPDRKNKFETILKISTESAIYTITAQNSYVDGNVKNGAALGLKIVAEYN